MKTRSKGWRPMKCMESMIIRATQKKMMSYAVTRTVVGNQKSSSSVSSGQPRVLKGHRPELNQVSSTSGDWTSPDRWQTGQSVGASRETIHCRHS